MRVLSPVKQLRKWASDTVIQVLQRGATAEGMGEGSAPGRPHTVLFSYKKFSPLGLQLRLWPMKEVSAEVVLLELDCT